MNTIHTIAPFRWNGMWVFDDPVRNIYREPFVDTIPQMLDKIIPKAENQCVLLFSSEPFPGCEYTLEWRGASGTGNIYRCVEMHTDGWLCSVLLKYFHTPPRHIYVQLGRKIQV